MRMCEIDLPKVKTITTGMGEKESAFLRNFKTIKRGKNVGKILYNGLVGAIKKEGKYKYKMKKITVK